MTEMGCYKIGSSTTTFSLLLLAAAQSYFTVSDLLLSRKEKIEETGRFFCIQITAFRKLYAPPCGKQFTVLLSALREHIISFLKSFTYFGNLVLAVILTKL